LTNAPDYTGFVLSLKRRRQPEIMDSPNLDETRHRRALDALQRVNRVSLSAAQLWADVRHVAPRARSRPLRVLDLACGGGDVAVGFEAHARRHGVDVRVSGCDSSPVAVARASERAAEAGSTARFFRLDVLRDDLPDDADVVYSTLFLHHLDEADAVGLLARMSSATRRMLVVQDLARSRIGYSLAYLGLLLLTRSDVARTDGPRSVQAAFTPSEAVALARRAGLAAHVRRCWPQRYSLTWVRH
jgi:SAM-dependent methyltransferase